MNAALKQAIGHYKAHQQKYIDKIQRTEALWAKAHALDERITELTHELRRAKDELKTAREAYKATMDMDLIDKAIDRVESLERELNIAKSHEPMATKAALDSNDENHRFLPRPPYIEAAEEVLESMPELGYFLWLWQEGNGRIKAGNGKFQRLIDQATSNTSDYRKRFKETIDAA